MLRSNASENTQHISPSHPRVCHAVLTFTRITEILAHAPGTDLSAKGRKGMSALMLAAENGHTDALVVLLERGADADKADNDGFTPVFVGIHPTPQNDHSSSYNPTSNPSYHIYSAHPPPLSRSP